MRTNILYPGSILLLLFCISCSNDVPEKTIAAVKKTGQDTTTAVSVEQTKDVLTPADIKQYTDSLSVYFRKESGEKDYTCLYALDSVAIKGGKEYYYRIFRKGVNSRLEDLHVYSFSNDSLATDLFNDLKTQELILPVGINKECNDITLNGNKVIWHNLSHGYAHRMGDYKEIFNRSVTIGTLKSNADSVAGFSYCGCQGKDAKLDKLIGKWRIIKAVKVYTPEHINEWVHSDNQNDSLSVSDIIEIKNNGAMIREVWNVLDDKRALKLPDSYYYFKYTLDEYSFGDRAKEEREKRYDKKYLDLLEALSQKHLALIDYSLYFKPFASISFVQLSNNETYVWYGNNFYQLKKTK